MKIIFSKFNGIIGTIGEITENETHYIQDDTYFDKATYDVITEIEMPDDFSIDIYLVKDNKLIKKIMNET